MLSGRFLYLTGGTPPTPTHALGHRPSLDRFAQPEYPGFSGPSTPGSEYPRIFRIFSTPDFPT